MNANELRIGNWVYQNDRFCVSNLGVNMFQWDLCDWYSEGNGTQSMKDIEPIELNEKLLNYFGFKYAFGKKEALFLPVNHDFGIWAYKKDKFKLAIFMMDKFNTTEIKYVHQLQNLYFALTYEELFLI